MTSGKVRNRYDSVSQSAEGVLLPAGNSAALRNILTALRTEGGDANAIIAASRRIAALSLSTMTSQVLILLSRIDVSRTPSRASHSTLMRSRNLAASMRYQKSHRP